MTTLGILTSGGDSPGTNAAIEAVVRRAAERHVEVVGFERGFAGLAADRLRPLSLAAIDGVCARGGTILGTSRDRTIAEEEGRARVLATLEREGISGLVLLGGDGSIRHGGAALREMNVRCVSIPCTIDNDVPGTERTLGHDSACNRAIELADGIKDTAQALSGRIFVLETLGGDSGFIALAVAEATYADVVLLPEYPLDQDYAAQRLRAAVEARGYALAVASEGAGDMHGLSIYLAGAAGHRVRLSSLGHAQRGGSPSFLDRWLARRFGELAVDALLASETAAMAAYRGGDTLLVPLDDVLTGEKHPDRAAFDAINELRPVW